MIKEIAPLSPTGLLPQKVTPWSQGVKADKSNRQEKNKKSHLKWGDKETTANRKERGGSPERLLNEMEATKLSTSTSK